MVFTAPAWASRMGHVPDVSLVDFMFDERYGRASFDSSLPPYVCSVSGAVISAREQKSRVETLAKGLASELDWKVNAGSELDKVVGVFALNTVDLPTLTWAIHRLNGVCMPVNAAFTERELARQLARAKAKVLFTVKPLLPVALKAAKRCGIPERSIYICDMSHQQGPVACPGYTSISDLLARGASAPEIEAIAWAPGQAKRQIAFLSHSSGTSGPPKIAMISHGNLISNVMQLSAFEQTGRGGPDHREVVLGVLPHSHIYSVVVISHLSTYRGDSIIVLPKFSIKEMLESVAKYRIAALNVVPPIIVSMSKDHDLLKQYDLSSVTTVVSGGAPLGDDTVRRIHSNYPSWVLRQAYGLTEVAACACHTSAHDPWAGSSGSVLPGVQIKLIDEDGNEVVGCDDTGEIWVQSPSIIPGYFDDDASNESTFEEDDAGRWLKTGDIGRFCKSPSSNEHIFIVDRIKELIKVKGNQVVPSELEQLLLTHPGVAECAVIGIKDSVAGEYPRAYIQRLSGPPSTALATATTTTDEELSKELHALVEEHMARFKWLRGGIVFVETIPKSPSGKTLRRLIRDQAEKELAAAKANL